MIFKLPVGTTSISRIYYDTPVGYLHGLHLKLHSYKQDFRYLVNKKIKKYNAYNKTIL